jgi:hypothetical protein
MVVFETLPANQQHQVVEPSSVNGGELAVIETPQVNALDLGPQRPAAGHDFYGRCSGLVQTIHCIKCRRRLELALPPESRQLLLQVRQTIGQRLAITLLGAPG